MARTSLTPLVTHPAPWTGNDLARAPAQWLYELSAEEIGELDEAINRVVRDDVPFTAIDRTSFPLPTLAARVAAWVDQVRDGFGFVVIRGLPVMRWSLDETRRGFLGLGRHIGELIRQNAAGDLVADVRAERGAGDPSARRYETSDETPFHTDGSDMIALLCLRQGRSGGQSSIVSSVAVINQVAHERPDLVSLLFEPWPFAMTADATDHFELPLVSTVSPFSLFYIRWYIEQSQSQANTPRLSARHTELLDLIDAAACEHHLEIEFRPGDLQLLSNRTVMHARTTFEDWDEPARRRHLLRLWLQHHDSIA